MPLFRQFSLGGASVAVWEITESASELLSLLGDKYAAEASRLRDGQRRAEWLAVRLLLARLCGPSACIAYDTAGRPVLVGAEGDISISHTRGYAVLAHSPHARVGVDVELAGRNAVSAARRFVGSVSAISLAGEDSAAKTLAFWCSCEAIFKVTGNVGGTYKDNLSVMPFELAGQGCITVSLNGLPSYPARDFTVSYMKDGGLFIALCME